MTPISSKIHSTFEVKITLKRELKYRSKKYSQIGVNWGLFFFTPLLESNLLLENNSVQLLLVAGKRKIKLCSIALQFGVGGLT